MRPSDLPQVRALRLFESMSDSSFSALMQASYLQAFPAQLELIHEGEPADFLYVVVEGCVELYAKSNGREATMAMVHPVGSFILAAVLKDVVYLMSARTCSRSKLLLIPAQNVREALKADDEFARAIVQELASCYRGVVKEYKSLKLRTSVEQLANRLLRYGKERGDINGRFELPYDKKTLASLLGMTPENLSRSFNTLKPYGVEVNGSQVTLSDVKALANLAKPNPLVDERGN
jgi:CRP/FNR family transcriptional activator FtrB